jgi:hypothetical protein
MLDAMPGMRALRGQMRTGRTAMRWIAKPAEKRAKIPIKMDEILKISVAVDPVAISGRAVDNGDTPGPVTCIPTS